jgi:type II secretory pathway component PulF
MTELRSVWRGLLWACATWLAHFVVLFVIFLAFVVCVPSYVAMYDYLDMDLPAITVSFIKFSELMVSYWYLLVIPLFFDFAFLIGASLSGPKLRWVARAWSTCLLFGTILLFGMTILVTALPFQEYAKRHAETVDAPGDTEPAQETL